MPDRWITRDRAVALLAPYFDLPVVAAILARPELTTRERKGRRGPALWLEEEIRAVIAEATKLDPRS